MLRALLVLALALASSIAYAQGSLYIRSQSSGGAGTVGINGTPTANQCATWFSATDIQGVDCPSLTGTPAAGNIDYWTSASAKALLSGTGILRMNGSSAPTVDTVTGSTVGTSDTQTLTNKRVTKRVVALTDATSFTPNADTSDIPSQTNTQATGTLTANAPSGTPTDGQPLLIRIKSTNVQTFAWNAIYRAGTAALPTASTGGSKWDYYSFIFNSADTKWDYVGSSTGF